ncbi:MAG: sigma-54 dependent transcriptional regulator [Marinobacter sp.]|uniref:sigma-54 interaction domain-containing protein n=1 Tax=Marinobacter sp. TaxID=50741 RepID=UPI0032971FD3
MALIDATRLSPLNQGNSDHLLIVSYGKDGRLCEALGIPQADRNFEEHKTGDNNERFEGELGMLFSPTSKMHQVAEEVTRVAPTSATVFLRGESGTGKEIVAQAIHQLSERRNEPFVPVNCGAISPQLIESELFGHEKGSFTGAIKEHRGVFERADGGTLFLDEVTEMPIDLQVKLLRVLETRRFTRVGSDRELSMNIRVIAATNRCPDTEVKEGRFRCDLLYRLQVFPILLPPLRERAGDIKLLAEHFLSEMNKQEGTCKRLSDKALAELEKYTWPGNLRELKNILQRAFIMSDSVIGPEQIPDEIMNPLEDRDSSKGPCLKISVGSSIADVEKDLIFATLEECKGRKERAANILGVSMKTLYNRLRDYQSAGEESIDPR